MTKEYWDPKNETMPLPELKQLQLKRLQKLVKGSALVLSFWVGLYSA